MIWYAIMEIVLVLISMVCPFLIPRSIELDKRFINTRTVKGYLKHRKNVFVMLQSVFAFQLTLALLTLILEMQMFDNQMALSFQIIIILFFATLTQIAALTVYMSTKLVAPTLVDLD